MNNPMDWYRAMTPEEAWAWWKTATPEQKRCFRVLMRRETRLVGRRLRDACASTASAIRAFAEAVEAAFPEVGSELGSADA